MGTRRRTCVSILVMHVVPRLCFSMILDTKSSPILKSEAYMMLKERLDYQIRLEWAEWILKYVIPLYWLPGADLSSISSILSGSVQSIIRRRRRAITRTTEDERPRPSRTRHSRGSLQEQEHEVSAHPKCALLKVPWEGREGKGGKEDAVKTCSNCSGRGVKVTLHQIGL